MGWKKWAGLIILSIVLLPVFGLGLWVIPLYLGWKYIKLCIKLDFYTIYLAVRIPIWLFIQVPAHALKVGAGKVTGFFEGVLDRFRSNSRAMGFFTLLFLGLFILFVPVGGGVFQSTTATFGLLVSYVIPGLIFSITLSATVAAIWNLVSDGQVARSVHDTPADVQGAKQAVEGAAAGVGASAAQDAEAAKEMADKAKNAKGVYDDIKTKGAEGVEAEDLAAVLPSDLAGVLTSISESLPFVEGIVAGSTSLGPAIIAVLVVLLILLLIMVVQWILVLGWFFATVEAIMPAVGGPVMGVLGVGGAYADMFGQQAANRLMPGIGQIGVFEQTSSMISTTTAKLGCYLQGPACFRQWQLNNTQRPGSQDVGEQYGLKIESFRVGQGSNLDVAYKDTDYAIPISFTISNPRHGLKGINAKDVNYRLRIVDASRTYCDTGWVPVDAYDVDADGQNNDIYPGTSASTGFLTLDDPQNGDPFTLKSCGFLQPALGSFKTVMLEVKYDYFSQSTLYFQAMSLQNLQSDPSIQKEMKESRTADTPVKAAISVNEPVLFDQDTMDPQPFAVRSTLNTEEFDLEYQVNSLEVRKSQETERSPGRTCKMAERDGDDWLELTPEAQDSILADGATGKRWFTSSRQPPIFGCTMQLSDPDTISPSGETLTMGVRANYTVALSEQIDSFKVYNSLCGPRLDCPLLVTRYYNNTVASEGEGGSAYSDYPWLTRCTGVDAGNGCAVVKGPTGNDDEWNRNKLLTGSGNPDFELEVGEVAIDPVGRKENAGYTLGPVLKEGGEGSFTERAALEEREVAAGVSERALRIIQEQPFIMYVVVRSGSNDVRVERMEKVCRRDGSEDERKREVLKEWMGDRGRFVGDVLAFRIRFENCSSGEP